MLRTKNGYLKMSLPKFRNTMNLIAAKMKDNVHFPTLQPLIDMLIAKIKEYESLEVRASKGDREAIALRNNKGVEVSNLLHKIGFHVSAIADGDVAIMESSGFAFTRPPQPSEPLVTPKTPVAKSGVNKGEIVVTGKKQHDSNTILFMIKASDPDATWSTYKKSVSQILFSNLISGKSYQFKYQLLGVRNQVVESEVISYIPQ